MEQKNCPCCNGKAEAQEVRARNDYLYGYIVKCNMCGMQTKIYKTPVKAWDAWNTRYKDEKDI